MGVRLIPPGLMSLFDLGSCTEVSEQRSAEDRLDLSRPYITRVYRRRFRITTVDAKVGPLAVREFAKAYFGLQIGCYYQLGTGIESWSEYDMLSFCTNIVTTPYSDDGCGWMIDVQYEPIDPQMIAIYESPLDARPEISFDGVPYQKTMETGAAIVPEPFLPYASVQNSAGDQWDPPPQMDDCRSTMSVRMNIQDYDPMTGLGFRREMKPRWENAVNRQTWFKFDPLTVKISHIRATPQWHPTLCDPTSDPPRSGLFWQIESELQIKPDTWVSRIADQGYRERDWSVTPTTMANITDKFGQTITAPALLDGAGKAQKIKDDDGAPNTIKQYALQILPYNALNFRDFFGPWFD